jgi:TonB-linked SusC/RagA family outer membrane protein
MRKLVTALFVLLLLQLSQTTFAQERTITGVVLSSDNTPVDGASVLLKGKKEGTNTNPEGKFSIRAATGDVLVISAVGFSSREVKVGSSAGLSITLQRAKGQLEEVVVTAMDIKRSARSLPYSTQQIGGDDLKESQRENFLNGIQGRIAGATVTSTSGLAGSSSSIVLRGFNSLSQSNQPLFVIDGVVVSNETVDENSYGSTGVGIVDRTGLTSNTNRNSDYTNRIADINSNDIASITVLKGPEATALYGSQASSGAIIITTRKAKSNKLAVQYDNSFRIQKVTRYPDVIDAYQPGTNGDTLDVFRYFGPAYPAGTKLYNNKDAFFRTGFSQNHNLGVDFGFKNSVFRFSSSWFDQDAVVPNNSYDRFNIRLSNTTKIGKWFDMTPTVTYIRTDNSKVLRSSGGFLLSLLSWPNTNDITATQGDNGSKVPLFSSNPNADYDNPLFNVNSNKSGDFTDRYMANMGINIRPTDWLTLAGRFGYETFNTTGWLRYHPLSYYVSASTGGLQDNWYRKYSGYNHTITATAHKKINDFDLQLMVGTMWQDYNTQMYAVTGTGIVDSTINGVMYKDGYVVTGDNYTALTGPATDSNATKTTTRQRLLRNVYGQYNESIIREAAYFGEFNLGYRNLAFLTYSHRFEQASTLPAQNRKYNYPGVGLSLIVSDIFPGIKRGNVINYLKLRGSAATTARLNAPYSTQSLFVNNLASGGGFSYGYTNNNPDLMPELQHTYEMGTEWRLFNNKINLDVTYYNTLNKGQIIQNFRLSYGTGFVLNTQNAGSTRNQGIEVSLDATIASKNDFSWNMMFNFNKMWNEVTELPKNVTEYYLADTWLYGNARGGVILGSPTTTITSFGYMRNDAGDILINPTTGLPVIDATFKVRGDRNPDFTLGWNNQFSYKNWRLNFLWDFKVGGDIFNGTEEYLNAIGRSKTTADRLVPRVIKGVLQDGLENTADPTQNTIVITPYTYDSYYRNMPEEAFIEKDVNWARLRELTLSYTFPRKKAGTASFIKGLSVFGTANDLILITNYSGADPGINGNTAGEQGVGTFGFDYGTLPSPISLNFGLRASF